MSDAPRALTPQELRRHLTDVLLRAGQFEEAWKLYEERPTRLNWSQPLSFPEWKGEPVQSLLVLPEQGLGDQIQFARYVVELRNRGVQVTMISPPPLVRLFKDLGVTVLPMGADVAVPRHDAWVLIASLPGRLEARTDNIPRAPYLPSSGEAGSGVGLATKGAAINTLDHERSLPDDLSDEMRGWPGMTSLHPEDSGAADMAATARLIDGLELVVAVDTAVAHVAGAMGKPCWLMVAHRADWRWLTGRDDTIWYPRHRLYRQREPGDWREVVGRVKADLARRSP
ncbi:glycosyltransferase family 9 protein [Phenylobacterium sp.]|uniref:glycosyltransferase family 9 protein n=1 Tax=Phenylobacterium sp. TaxID=1871053 RepID=UPI003568AF2A